MNELIPSFEKSLFDSSLAASGIDILEIGIDSVLQDGLFKDIPIVGTIVNMGKFAQNVHDRNLLRQTLNFINEFNSGNLSADEVEKHRSKLLDKPKNLEEELGRILIILNRNIDSIKSVLEAKFYVGYLKHNISWFDFCELCDITDRLFISDINTLEEAYIMGGVTEAMSISYKHDRLISVGLLTNEARLSGSIFVVNLDSDTKQYIMELTEIGRRFCELAFN